MFDSINKCRYNINVRGVICFWFYYNFFIGGIKMFTLILIVFLWLLSWSLKLIDKNEKCVHKQHGLKTAVSMISANLVSTIF